MHNLDSTLWDERIVTLYDYWCSICPQNGEVPLRADFDPARVRQILSWVWMVSAHSQPTRFKFRLLGTDSVQAMGRDVTGVWIDEAYPKFENSIGYQDYIDVISGKGPSYRKGEAHYHIASYKNIERIMLPMSENGKDVDIIAITVYD